MPASGKVFFLLAALSASAGAMGQVSVSSAWVRATVPGQTTSGAFMELKSPSGAILIGVESPGAGIAEIHEMKMEGDVMRMRAVSRVELPAGKSVELKPGGYHVMLMQLKKPLKAGGILPIRLRVETRDKAVVTVEVRAEIRDPSASAVSGVPGHGH